MKPLQNLLSAGAYLLTIPFRIVSFVLKLLTCAVPSWLGWRRLCLNQRESSVWLAKLLNRDIEARRQFSQYFNWHRKELIFCAILALLITGVDKIQQFFLAFALDIKETHVPPLQFATVFFGNGLLIFWLCYIFWHKPKGSKIPAQLLLSIERFLRWILNLLTQKKVERFDPDKQSTDHGLVIANRFYAQRYSTAINRWRLCVTATLPLLLTSAGLVLSLCNSRSVEISSTEPLPEWRTFAGMMDWINDHSLLALILFAAVYLLIAFLMQPRPIPNASLRTHNKNLILNILLLAGALGIIYTLMLCYHAMDQGWGVYCKLFSLGLFMFAPPLISAHVFNSLSECMVDAAELLEEGDVTHKNYPLASLYKNVYDRMMWVSYLITGVGLLLLNMKDVTVSESFSSFFFPIAILLFIAIVYYQAIDWLAYNLPSPQFYTIIVAFAVLVFTGPQEHYEIKYKARSKEANSCKRDSLEGYFLGWLKDRRAHNVYSDSLENNIYLVAAEGGGSRSGAWTSSVLTEIDRTMDGAFRQKCFAISGISGGSIGSAATLAWWDNARRVSNGNANIYSDDSARVKYVSRIFGRNYISTALAGIFFYDGFQQNHLFAWLYPSKYSRTDRLQDEEDDAVQLALGDVFDKKVYSGFPDHYLKETDFLELYYWSETGKPRFGLPLFFPNTCRVEEGRRGVTSAVTLNIEKISKGPKHPGNAGLLDIIKAKDDGEHANKRLSLGEATSLSELFPFVNSTVHINHSVGTFMDGGVYENMGLTTLYEIRASLRAILESPDKGLIAQLYPDTTAQKEFRAWLKTLRFNFVLIYNSEHPDHGKETDRERTLQLFDPITALLQTPFGGHTDYVYHKTINEFSKTDRFYEFPLLTHKDYWHNSKRKPTDPIIMSRWLSSYELKQILERSSIRVKEAFDKQPK